MSDIAAVSGATTTIKTLADGTFRLSIDIEPRHAQAAFALFGSPGTPVALARITNEAATAFDQREPEPEKPRGGALAKLAGMWSNATHFWEFCDVDNADDAAEWIRTTCLIESRAELDNSMIAKQNFEKFVRGPYMKFMQARGGA
ncbi:hypothetical protein [Paraburkholderia elongata]|uniref:Uncharacterized protein n=1 Tax=Paraburkholderia elongata TaxID=2675747 RepID=A0A972NVD1_9BURK|nr:hypothetical protein [Paraburkholderia elongata]NPT59074.1 hypothetical protein [Paraburkholderia elongata]